MPQSTLSLGEPRSYPAATNDDAGSLAANGNRSAVLIVHGMGQQRKFETLSQAADGIARSAGGETVRREARNVKIGDERLSRLELELEDGRRVDVYEAYWAPITEGQVNLRDVTAFMWNTARNGIANARRAFRRWIFDEHEELPGGGTKTLGALFLAAGVLGSLVFLNSLTLILGAARVMNSGPDWTRRPGVVEDVTAAILMLLCAAAGFAVLYFAARHRKKPGKRFTKELLVSRAGLWYFVGLCVETIAVTAAMLLAMTLQRTAFLAGSLLVGMTVLLLAVAALVALANVFVSKEPFTDLVGAVSCAALAVFVLLLAAHRASAAPVSIFDGFAIDDVPYVSAVVAWIADRWVAIWMALAWVSKQVRGFLVQYVGDVAAYVSPSTLDRFDTLRERIRDCTFKTANAIYRVHKGGSFVYRNVVVVGHSLGSVAAYDGLNRMLNEDGHAGGALRVRERTSGLVTFGSPLDKTAFLFEVNAATSTETRAALAATVQPLIAHKETRSIPWSNIHSPWDIFSGPLDFYGRRADGTNRVANDIDRDAVTPVGAHNEYWSNRMIWQRMCDYLPHKSVALPAMVPRLRERRG